MYERERERQIEKEKMIESKKVGKVDIREGREREREKVNKETCLGRFMTQFYYRVSVWMRWTMMAGRPCILLQLRDTSTVSR